VPPITAELLQWLVNQGVGVVVALVALYLLIVRMDKLGDAIDRNTRATDNLAALVDAHMPPGRRPTPPPA
jgi:hypothetical protein